MKKLLFMILLLSVSFSLCSCEKFKVVVLSAKATSARNSGEMERAEALYKEIIVLQPDVPEHYWELGAFYISANKKYQARQQLEKLKKMGREDLVESLQKIIDL